MKAFVTGSTGLLGSNLVNALLEAGYEVKALARSAEKARKILTDPRIEIVTGDMEAIDAFADELTGCDVLFHVAAYFREYYSTGDHWARLEKINVHGTIRLLTEGEKRGVKKAIYVSSSGVIGLTPDGRPSDETTPPDTLAQQNLYFKSKVAAEQAVAKFLKTHNLPVVLILPTAIIGPQDAAPTALGQAIVDILHRKIPVVPPGGLSFVDARDVAQGMIKAVEHGRSGERYLMTTGYHTMAELAAAVEKASGVPAPRLSLPFPVLAAVAGLGEVAARFTGREPQLSLTALNTMRVRREINAAKATRELGITFRPFEETIRDEVHWYINNGYVQGEHKARNLQTA